MYLAVLQTLNWNTWNIKYYYLGTTWGEPGWNSVQRGQFALEASSPTQHWCKPAHAWQPLVWESVPHLFKFATVSICTGTFFFFFKLKKRLLFDKTFFEKKFFSYDKEIIQIIPSQITLRLKLEFDSDSRECILTFMNMFSIYLSTHLRDTRILLNKGKNLLFIYIYVFLYMGNLQLSFKLECYNF